MKKTSLLMAMSLCLASMNGQAADDLIMSEYIEGSSYNKAIELYNDTGSNIDLTGYTLEFYFNGNTSPLRTIDLLGSVDSGDVFVIAQSQAASDILDQADQTDSSTSWFNGDDAIVLKNNGTIIDSIGQVGFDPGSEWGNGDTSTKDNTLYRTSLIADIDPSDEFDPTVLWQGEAKNTFADIGNYGSTEPEQEPEEPSSFVKIHEIQGSGSDSPLNGQLVTVEAVVTAEMLEGLNGFYIQEELADQDASALTSEGIFVYSPSLTTSLSVGDKVQVSGKVTEYYGLTEIKDVTSVVVIGSGLTVSPQSVSLPFASTDYMERYEGMLVTLPQTLTVTENYDLGRYGEFWLSSGGRLQVPTNVVAPGAAAIALQQANDLNRILVDDYSTQQNPDPVIYPAPQLDAFNTLRSGNEVASLTGVVTYGYDYYRILPTVAPVFNDENPRSLQPEEMGGTLKVASFNVLNFFNGDGQGGGFPTSRGADTFEEFERQQAKIVAAMLAMNADIIGLMEIENDGYGSNSAIASLVDALNNEVGSNRYAYVNPGVAQIGTDEIAVGLIYNQQTVALKGDAAILDSSVDGRFIDTKNRPVLAQSFEELSTEGVLTVAVNHLKSKGSSCDALGDPDTGDGQGNCNLTRTDAATALVDWLATDPTSTGDSDHLIIGDLNAYAKEDPITAIQDAGYQDLIANEIADGYSYIYYGQSGYLDHALASGNLTSQVAGITQWHINADEPRVLDYNTEYKTANQILTYFEANAYRSSDHDPVIVSFNLQSDAMLAETVFVSGLDAQNKIQSRTINRGSRSYTVNQRTITVSINIKDNIQNAVEGATVDGSWVMNGYERSASCVTNANGACSLVLRTRDLTYPTQFKVLDISADGLSYLPESNQASTVDVNQ